ncbi:MAG: ABC transporter permease [Pseudolysinimonas sp.]|uniref:ABC transporter permease n=1 Tax=Pseudolysinimonas sp. TaxID=2680009 RepID=UPI003262CFBA
MNFLLSAFAFIFDPTNWLGDAGIGARLLAHLGITVVSILIALVLAVPLGLLIGHTGRGRSAVIALTGAARALPTFGVLILFVLIGINFGAGLSLTPVIAVLAVLAVPPLLAGAYSGVEAVDRETVDSARAMGMTEWQILTRVELPLALPLLVGGLRSATLQVIATATIAAYVAQGGLGRYLIEGIQLRDYTRAVVGAILVAALALLVDGILAVVQKLVVPRGVSRGATRTTSSTGMTARRPTRSPDATRTPVTEG